MEKIIFLDFDGVLVDSVKEAYAVAYRAFYKKEPYFTSNKYKTFKKYRYLIGPAWNYYYLLKAIDSKNVEQEYRSLISTAKKIEHEAFELEYFQIREMLKKDDINLFMSYQKPYEFADKIGKIVKSLRITPIIVTTKDENTVRLLLEAYTLQELSETIFGKKDYDKFSSKAAIIKNRLLELSGDYKALFVDDLPQYLKECEGIQSLDLIQARWGYVDTNNMYLHNKECDEIIAYILKEFGG